MNLAPRSITAEILRPPTVDADGNPVTITGDAPADPGPPAPTASSSAPAPTASSAAPPPAPAPSSAPPAPSDPTPPGAPAAAGAAGPGTSAPAPVAAGITTADILAALGHQVPALRVNREPSPYFEAGAVSTRHGFFADLYAARTRGDVEAGRRAAQFQSQLRDYIAAASNDSTSGSDLIGPAWGGQWYVAQIEQLRPLTSAFTTATITDNRPIPVPKFRDTTPAALVNDHVEGQPDPPEWSISTR